MKMAKASERPNLPWEFHVVNDASVNAFALPGGFIYVTRGLMTVDQRRGRAGDGGRATRSGTSPTGTRCSRSARRRWRSSASASAASCRRDVARVAGLASQGLSVLFLKYSRDAENQADLAGFRYALNQNYDVREMANVFQTLDRVSKRGRRRQAAGVARDPPRPRHPHPEHPGAARHAAQGPEQARSSTATGTCSTSQNMTYGEDPRQGFFEGGTFYHPDLRFQLTFPQGWKTQNGAEAVMAGSPQQDAIIQLSLAGKTLAAAGGAAVPVAAGRPGGQHLDAPASTACRRPRATSRRRPSRARCRGW